MHGAARLDGVRPPDRGLGGRHRVCFSVALVGGVVARLAYPCPRDPGPGWDGDGDPAAADDRGEDAAHGDGDAAAHADAASRVPLSDADAGSDRARRDAGGAVDLGDWPRIGGAW